MYLQFLFRTFTSSLSPCFTNWSETSQRESRTTSNLYNDRGLFGIEEKKTEEPEKTQEIRIYEMRK